MKTDREPDFYKNKIQRAEKDIEREKAKRNLSEKDPEVAYEKYMRSKKDLDSKLMQIERIENNVESLIRRILRTVARCRKGSDLISAIRRVIFLMKFLVRKVALVNLSSIMKARSLTLWFRKIIETR